MDSCKLNANHRQLFLVDRIERHQWIKVKITVIYTILLLIKYCTEPAISYFMFESLINKTSNWDNCLFGTAQDLILDRV